MNEVGAGTIPNGPPDGLVVYVKLRRQRGDQPIDVCRFDCRDDIDVDGRTRLAGVGTGDGAADGVRDPERVECACHGQRDGDRIDIGRRHGDSSAADSG
jgi:hypothetical protein